MVTAITKFMTADGELFDDEKSALEYDKDRKEDWVTDQLKRHSETFSPITFGYWAICPATEYKANTLYRGTFEDALWAAVDECWTNTETECYYFGKVTGNLSGS
jgi:hypothetical protein